MKMTGRGILRKGIVREEVRIDWSEKGAKSWKEVTLNRSRWQRRVKKDFNERRRKIQEMMVKKGVKKD